MTHPTKEAIPLSDNPDRDLSWTLDSLHGFCRQEGLEDGDRHLSWSLGTFPDRWMYLNFITSNFTPHDISSDADEWIGSGIRCGRRTVTVPLGGPGGKETFREQRVWFSMRTATPYEDSSRQADAAKLKGPATVGFVLADLAHHPIRMTKKVWLERGMEPAKGCSGVTAFQMLLWGGIDEWSNGWNRCLDYVDRLYEVQAKDIDNSNPERLYDLMFDPHGWLATEYFVAAHLLKIFRRHIDVLPRSLEQMRAKWERIYPGVDSDLLQRFDIPTQLTLLRNWSRLVDHAAALQGTLADRIDKTSAELLNLRNSLMIARNTIRD
ncbi:hypothetical protein N658DRAFT_171855 [Parathielavia hyrcaniae]|uniref:Uncharacterized protein n=1 Tax=Parathielavia hyrcaniae TaxID=113614 RepID=A0AAN6T075_9PEZI|nr:hypothetical protein N658DRAFT_171855 [Parathielavia hyrcaniae]